MASHQGKYLGKKLSKLAKKRQALEAQGEMVRDEAVAKPFKYLHLGSLAYIGNAAVFDLQNASFRGGLVAMYAWRSVYWSEQVSARTRALLMFDWIIRCVLCCSSIGSSEVDVSLMLQRYLGPRSLAAVMIL